MPKIKPPFPANGLWNRPTVIIMLRHMRIFQLLLISVNGQVLALLNQKELVFALGGRLIIRLEVPMGTTIRHVVYDIGGGFQMVKIQAVQTGDKWWLFNEKI